MIPRINDGQGEPRRGRRRRAGARAEGQPRARDPPPAAAHRLGATLKPAAGRARPTERSPRARSWSPSVETAITADAKARARRARCRKVQGPTTCELAAGTAAAGDVGVFDCFMVVRKVPKVETNPPGAIGYPFRAVVDYDDLHLHLVPHRAVPRREADPGPAHGRAAPRRLPRNLIAGSANCALEGRASRSRELGWTRLYSHAILRGYGNLAEDLDTRLAALWHVLGRRGKRELSRTAASVLATLRDTGAAPDHRARRERGDRAADRDHAGRPARARRARASARRIPTTPAPCACT